MGLGRNKLIVLDRKLETVVNEVKRRQETLCSTTDGSRERPYKVSICESELIGRGYATNYWIELPIFKTLPFPWS